MSCGFSVRTDMIFADPPSPHFLKLVAVFLRCCSFFNFFNPPFFPFVAFHVPLSPGEGKPDLSMSPTLATFLALRKQFPTNPCVYIT